MENCRRCGKAFPSEQLTYSKCPDCTKELTRQRHDAEERADIEGPASTPTAIFLTTESGASIRIADRLGIITSECVLGTNIFEDLGAKVRDLIGGRSVGYQRALREAKDSVLADLQDQAQILGADAVVAVALNYSQISGGGKSMLFLVGTGTAVRLSGSV